MLKRVALVGGVALAMSLTVAGCGSGSDSSSGGSSDDITIGVIGSYTGAFPTLNVGAKYGIEAWAKSVNAAGGINGHKVNLIVKDDKGDAATAVTAVKTLITQDKVVAIVGHQSQQGKPWAKIASAAGIPVVGGSAYDLEQLSDANFYAVGGNLLSSYYGIAELAKERGGKVGNLYCSEVPACAATTSLLKGFGGTDLKVVYDAGVSATAPDYTAVCQGLKDSGAEAFSMGMSAPTMRTIAQQCTTLGFKQPLIIPDSVDSSFAKDPAFEGTQYASPLIPFYVDNTPATKEFHAAIEKYYPFVGTAKQPFTQTTIAAWASGKLFETVAKKIDGKVTPEAVKAGLYALNGETLGGLAPPLTFTKGKPSMHNCYYFYEIKDSAYVAPKGLDPICAPAGAVEAIAAKLGG